MCIIGPTRTKSSLRSLTSEYRKRFGRALKIRKINPGIGSPPDSKDHPLTPPQSNIAKQTHRTRADPAKIFHRTHGQACSQSGRSDRKERSIVSDDSTVEEALDA